jgi:hypothetical protein
VSCPEAVAVMANMTAHAQLLKATVAYIRLPVEFFRCVEWKGDEHLRAVYKKPFFEILSGFFHFLTF